MQVLFFPVVCCLFVVNFCSGKLNFTEHYKEKLS